MQGAQHVECEEVREVFGVHRTSLREDLSEGEDETGGGTGGRHEVLTGDEQSKKLGLHGHSIIVLLAEEVRQGGEKSGIS